MRILAIASMMLMPLWIVGCQDTVPPTAASDPEMTSGTSEPTTETTAPTGEPTPPEEPPPPPENPEPAPPPGEEIACEAPEEHFFEVDAPIESREQECARFGDFVFSAPFPPGTEGGFYMAKCGLGYQVSLTPVVESCPGNGLPVEHLTACVCAE